MRRKNLAPEYTNICSHCGKNLHTAQEYSDGMYDRCKEAYDEEMYAMYGEDLYL